MAHIGGFVSGIGLGLLLLTTKIVKPEKSEKSLLQILDFREKQEPKLEISSELAEMVKNKGVCLKKYAVLDNHNSKGKEKEISLYKRNTTSKDDDIDTKPETLFTIFNMKNNPDDSINNKTLSRIKNIRLKEKNIYFSCECGKKIKMPVKFAGKKGRCPQCNNVIHIPKLSV